ncbi:MAG: type II toxin-antitoxin system RelE/ParE family toxin [Acidobacteriota bacterium]|nr:type II toxin-antitoxin system RelE/ParE family toxin [Acidobacteriota bacterium]
MTWIVAFHEEFDAEFEELAVEVQEELLAQAKVVEHFGPQTGRPRVDTLHGSQYANMKELRFEAADGVWRVAFAFDPRRRAILLVAGDKSGVSEKRFYRQLIAKADERYRRHLRGLSARRGEGKKPS